MIINSFNSWGRLREVWLGDVYPTSWYDHLPSEVRDVFCQLTDITKHDLGIIHKKLRELDIVVCRPCYEHIDNFINVVDGKESLTKPSVMPRDSFVTIGNTLFTCGMQPAWNNVILDLKRRGGDVRRGARGFAGANVVRAGRDLYIDAFDAKDLGKIPGILALLKTNSDVFEQYRVHKLNNGGHMDGCFAIMKPKLILASRYFEDYAKTFPGWDLINTGDPEFKGHKSSTRSAPGWNGKWWLPGVTLNRAFNDHIINHARDWVGDYTETFFEVNCLVIDEKNVLMLGEHDLIFRCLEDHGITPHSLPFRTRSFWDGGLHCLTLDIRRDGDMQDYFPERSDAG